MYARLAGYPAWDEFHLTDLREYRATLALSQVKARAMLPVMFLSFALVVAGITALLIPMYGVGRCS